MRHKAFRLKSIGELVQKRERPCPIGRFGEVKFKVAVIEIVRNGDAISICDWQDFMLAIAVELLPIALPCRLDSN